jgi:hypothetical protein
MKFFPNSNFFSNDYIILQFLLIPLFFISASLLPDFVISLSSIIFLNVSCSQINKSPVVPHLIVITAKVVTLDSDRPIAQAIAMHDGKFLAVGNNAQILALGNSQTQIIDAQERTILPGLTDEVNVGLSELDQIV